VTFTIGYTPVEYGKVKTGKLIIQTAEYYWNFVVKGTFPKYVPPKPDHSKVDNRLESKKPTITKNAPPAPLGSQVPQKADQNSRLAQPKP
jgi:hypothetical protein